MKIKFEDGWIRTEKGFGPLPNLIHRNGKYALLHIIAHTGSDQKTIPARHILVRLDGEESGFINATVLKEEEASFDWRQARERLVNQCDRLAEMR